MLDYILVMSKPPSILRRNLLLSLGFGLCMGVVFPLYSLAFVDFKSPLLAVFFCAGCLAAGLLVGVFGYFINTRPVVRLARRVNEAIDAAKASSAGPPELGVDSDDVIGELARNFIDSLGLARHSLEELKSLARGAVAMSAEAEAAVDSSARASRVLASTLALISDAARDFERHNERMEGEFEGLSKATLLNVSNIIELYSSVSEFGEALVRQTESLDHVVETIRGIERAVGAEGRVEERSLSGLEASLGARIVDTVATSLEVFAAVKGRIAEIEGIAERTNVLSINAAIEAARLGKEGAGFRVIAANVKGLAEESRALTSRVALDMAEGERSLSSVTGFLREALEAQTALIGEIRDSIASLSGRNEALSAHMERTEGQRAQIDALLKDIRDNMQELKRTVGEARESMIVLTSSSELIRSGIGTLSEKAAAIEAEGERARESLARYKARIEGLGEAAR